MSTPRRRWSKQFKLEAIAIYERGEKSLTQVEDELNITRGMLGKWCKKYRESANPVAVFPGPGQRTPQEERIWQLERRVQELEQEKAILKKVLQLFSREAP